MLLEVFLLASYNSERLHWCWSCFRI